MIFRLTAYISGRVQKAGYRARVVALAEDMGLAGFVQNLPDGRVEVVAEGKKDILERFAAALKIKNTFTDVKDIMWSIPMQPEGTRDSTKSRHHLIIFRHGRKKCYIHRRKSF